MCGEHRHISPKRFAHFASEQNISHALNSEKVGVFTGTGFIVDKNEGIIATNYHV